MRGRPLLVGAASVASLAAVAVTVWKIRERSAVETEVLRLVEAARREMEREPFDRESATACLLDLRRHPSAKVEPRLTRARARLELALGRVQEAWDAEQELALRPAPAPEDMLLAAVLLERLHGVRGNPEDLDRAMTFAEQHWAATGDPASLFLAWQCAVRGERPDEQRRLAESLAASAAGTPQAKLVESLTAEHPELGQLRAIEGEWATVPIELDFAIASLLVREEGSDQPREAIERIERALAASPSWVHARSVAAAAYDRAGDAARRDSHLDWLLLHAPADDERRATWSALRQAPVEARR